MNKKDELMKLKERVLENESLPLKKGATNLVFGVGNPDAEILFIGEGPGYWEDIKGEPFVGNAGALLNQLLSLIKVERKSVFITNVIMYRPPENRDPLPEEIKAYEPYLDEIIKIIDPKIIVTLGRFSMAKFIPGVFISSVHGKPKELLWKGKSIIVIPMYHPAAGLRSLDVKEKLKEDFLMLPGILEKTKHQETGNIKREEVEQIKLL